MISIFSSLDGFTSLTFIFLDFFFVEKKRFCGTKFLLCGAFYLGVGRCLLPCSQIEVNKLWAELMLLSNCCKVSSFLHPSMSLTIVSSLVFSDCFRLSLSVSRSLLGAFFRQSLRKLISAVFLRNSSYLCHV